MPRDEAWDKVRDEVSCLDSIGDAMLQALDALEGKWPKKQESHGAEICDLRHKKPFQVGVTVTLGYRRHRRIPRTLAEQACRDGRRRRIQLTLIGDRAQLPGQG